MNLVARLKSRAAAAKRHSVSQDEQQAKLAANAFDLHDADGNGSIDIQELEALTEEMGYPFFSAADVEESHAMLDTDGDGGLSKAEWVSWWVARARGNPSPEKQQKVVAGAAFSRADQDGNGRLDMAELGSLCEGLGLPLDETELGEAMEMLDTDGNNMLEKKEFVEWWIDRSVAGGGGKLAEKLAKVAAEGRKRMHTDIHTASWQGDLALVKDFLNADIRLANSPDTSEFGDDFRPLHYAAYNGHLDVCRALREGGAKILALTARGCSALFFAAQQGHLEVVRFLLESGADPTAAETESGLSYCPVDVAKLHLCDAASCESGVEDASDGGGDGGGNVGRQMLDELVERGGLHAPLAPEWVPVISRRGERSIHVKAGGEEGYGSGRGRGGGGRKDELVVTQWKVKVVKCRKLSEQTPPQEGEGAREAEEQGEEGREIVEEEGVGEEVVELLIVPCGGTTEGGAGRGGTTAAGNCIHVKGLDASTSYRVYVADINAVGAGPYGRASKVVTTLEEGAQEKAAQAKRQQKKEREEAKRTSGAAGGGKGRAVAARERRLEAAQQRKVYEKEQLHKAETLREKRERMVTQAARAFAASQQQQQQRKKDGVMMMTPEEQGPYVQDSTGAAASKLVTKLRGSRAKRQGGQRLEPGAPPGVSGASGVPTPASQAWPQKPGGQAAGGEGKGGARGGKEEGRRTRRRRSSDDGPSGDKNGGGVSVSLPSLGAQQPQRPATTPSPRLLQLARGDDQQQQQQQRRPEGLRPVSAQEMRRTPGGGGHEGEEEAQPHERGERSRRSGAGRPSKKTSRGSKKALTREAPPAADGTGGEATAAATGATKPQRKPRRPVGVEPEVPTRPEQDAGTTPTPTSTSAAAPSSSARLRTLRRRSGPASAAESAGDEGGEDRQDADQPVHPGPSSRPSSASVLRHAAADSDSGSDLGLSSDVSVTDTSSEDTVYVFEGEEAAEAGEKGRQGVGVEQEDIYGGR